MELNEALEQIAAIRQQMARTELFRGYRALPVAFSGALAWGAAIYQDLCLADPIAHLTSYLTLWIGAAIVSAIASGIGMVWRARHSSTASCSREITRLAVEQFAPCIVAGGLLTIVLVRSAADSLWMLPGLWSILFSLGIFASRRLLPRATTLVALFYLAAGLICVVMARGPYALSPWAMGIPFGLGQFLAAAVLYGTLERPHGPEETE